MSKKKKRNRAGKGRAAAPRQRRHPQRARPEADEDLLADGISHLPYFSGELRQADVRRHLEEFGRYERWLVDGAEVATLDPSLYPPEYFGGYLRSDDGSFEYYRHSTFARLDLSIDMGRTFAPVFRGLVDRAAVLFPEEFKKFSHELNDASSERAKTQMENSIREYRSALATEDERDRLTQLLNWYCSVFEVDVALWFIGCLALLVKTGTCDLRRYGGPDSTTAQGALIKQVAEDASGTPLTSVLEDVYDIGLRNAVSHNAHRICARDDTHCIVALDTQTEWTYEELMYKFDSANALLNGTYHGIMHACCVAGVKVERKLSDRGILSALYSVRDGIPHVIMTQLWCFWEIDPAGDWLDATSAEVAACDEDTTHVFFTENACTLGEKTPSEFLEAIFSYGWLFVIRIPIAPAVHKGVPIVTMPGGYKYEIPGAPDFHFMPVSATTEAIERDCVHSYWSRISDEMARG